MKVILGVSLFVIIFGGVCGELRVVSDKINARLPRLFHLDDYDRCLLQTDGLYCLGIFELSPIEPSPVYEYIKRYSSNAFTFNRSRLHRGYCVSARCPSTANKNNATQRFEQCVNKQARRYALSARLRTLQYCTTRQQQKIEQQPDSAQQLFLRVVYAILVLNAIGTVYDFATGDVGKKNGILMAWSIRASWRRLTAIYDDGDPRLKELEPIQGLKVLAMLMSINAHVSALNCHYFTTNPHFMENLILQVYGIILSNGVSLIQIFVMISSFLTAYNLLLYSQTRRLSFLILPVLILKRIIRIAPVHLLLVGFAATWWPQMRSGALSAMIKESSVICRRKFWSHAFFLNNVVEKQAACLLPSWFLPVDMHLFIVAGALTIVMSRRRHLALKLYMGLFVISIMLCGLVNYVYERQAMIHMAVPENIRDTLRNIESFGGFYISSWGSLPACFLGLFTAHLHYELQEKKYRYYENQWLKHVHNWCFPVGLVWVIFVGSLLQRYRGPLATAAYITMDRPIICGLLFWLLFGTINIDGPIRRLCGWRGWRVPARLSLPVMLTHWLVIVVITARPASYHASGFDMNIDYLGTLFYGYGAAAVISILVEIPVQRFFSQLF